MALGHEDQRKLEQKWRAGRSTRRSVDPNLRGRRAVGCYLVQLDQVDKSVQGKWREANQRYGYHANTLQRYGNQSRVQ